MTQPHRFFFSLRERQAEKEKKIHRKQRLQLQQMTAVGPQVHNLPLSAVLEAACNYSACRSSSLSRAVSEREEGKRAGIANVRKQVLHMFVMWSGT